jgi:NADH dehydrogenase
MMATIGRKSAVAQLGPIRLHGMPAWVLWSAAHIYYLIGFRNRITVVLNWVWNYVTFQRGTRLITGLSGSRMEDMSSRPRWSLRRQWRPLPAHKGLGATTR